MASTSLLIYSLSHSEEIQQHAGLTKAQAMKVLSLMTYYAVR